MKPEKIVFVNEELQKSFEQLSAEDPIKKGLVKAIRDIQENTFVGRNVKKKIIPKELIQKYNISNL